MWCFCLGCKKRIYLWISLCLSVRNFIACYKIIFISGTSIFAVYLRKILIIFLFIGTWPHSILKFIYLRQRFFRKVKDTLFSWNLYTCFSYVCGRFFFLFYVNYWVIFCMLVKKFKTLYVLGIERWINKRFCWLLWLYLNCVQITKWGGILYLNQYLFFLLFFFNY